MNGERQMLPVHTTRIRAWLPMTKIPSAHDCELRDGGGGHGLDRSVALMGLPPSGCSTALDSTGRGCPQGPRGRIEAIRTLHVASSSANNARKPPGRGGRSSSGAAQDGTASKTSALCITMCCMKTLTIRTDAEVEQALESLTRDGQSRSEATRAAILEAERAHRRARLRAEAEQLRNDPDDVAASRRLAAEMDAIRAR